VGLVAVAVLFAPVPAGTCEGEFQGFIPASGKILSSARRSRTNLWT
jgi:hypothetical protein